MNSPWQSVALADKSASHTTYLLWHDSAVANLERARRKA